MHSKEAWLVHDRGNVICLTCSMCVERCVCPKPKLTEHQLRRFIEPVGVQPSIFDRRLRAFAVLIYLCLLLWIATR